MTTDSQDLALIEAQTNLWLDIPIHVQGILDRYIKHHAHPGKYMRGLLSGDDYAFDQGADDETWARRNTIREWLHLAAPEDCWGDEATVAAWLELGKIKTTKEKTECE